MLEKVEVTLLQGSLKVQRESLMTTEFRMRQAKEMTKELLSHHHDNGAALMANDHRKRVELDRLQLRTLIAGLKDLIPPSKKEEMEQPDLRQITWCSQG